MIEKYILDAQKQFDLFKNNQVVTVALSGGADSVALLFALNSLKDELKVTIKAAHLNHLIRGDEALRDESFVKELCNKLNIPLACEQQDVPKFAKEQGLSLETAARQVRYEFFNRINEGVIATAHTASDNLETVLLNLARGTALDGLCGIPPKRDSIVRPIIFATRQEIEDYCEKHSLKFVTDSTNLSNDYSRNKLRHSVVPVLRELNPKIEATVLRSSINLRDIALDIKATALKYIENNRNDNGLAVSALDSLTVPVAKRVITEFVKEINNEISLESCHIDAILSICLKSGKTGIPKNYTCRVFKGILYVENGEISEYKVKLTQEDKKINNLLLNNSLDCDKIVGKSVVRTRLSGDCIRLANRGCTKLLTKLYNECGIPLCERDSLPVIADDKGVIWIYNIGVAERCRVDKNTKRILKIEVTKGV